MATKREPLLVQLMTWFIWKTNKKKLQDLGKKHRKEVIWTNEHENDVKTTIARLKAEAKQEVEKEWKAKEKKLPKIERKYPDYEKKTPVEELKFVFGYVVEPAEQGLLSLGYTQNEIDSVICEAWKAAYPANVDTLTHQCIKLLGNKTK